MKDAPVGGPRSWFQRHHKVSERDRGRKGDRTSGMIYPDRLERSFLALFSLQSSTL